MVPLSFGYSIVRYRDGCRRDMRRSFVHAMASIAGGGDIHGDVAGVGDLVRFLGYCGSELVEGPCG